METKPKNKKRGRRPVQIDSQDGVQADRVPPEVRHLVNGTVINLAGASAFYRKKAEVATLLKDFVEPLPDSHYRLKNQFESWFLGSLRFFSAERFGTTRRYSGGGVVSRWPTLGEDRLRKDADGIYPYR